LSQRRHEREQQQQHSSSSNITAATAAAQQQLLHISGQKRKQVTCMAKSQRWSDWQSKSWATATATSTSTATSTPRWRLMPSQQISLMLLEGDKVICGFSELAI